MKNKILILLSSILFVTINKTCLAQDGFASGQCKLNIQKIGSEDVQHFFFSSDSGHTVYLNTKNEGTLSDFGFSGDFTINTGEVESIMPDFNISPPGAGTFMLVPFNSTPKSFSHITITFTGETGVITDQSKSCSGSVTISKYPPIGGYMTGSFHAIITNNINNYKVSGEFKIKRVH